jgi:uncharacterized protein YbaR (Trm112 family)
VIQTFGETAYDHHAQVSRGDGKEKRVMTEPAIDPRLLEILVCPLTKGPLTYDREAGELISRKAGLAYPIRDGIPIMLPDEARKLEA